jgi:hypothetical protein
MSRRERNAEAGAGKKTASGRERGKAASESTRKTMEWVADYLELLEGAATAVKMEEAIIRGGKAQSLARVIKAPGGKHLEVTLQDGTHEKSIPIAKSIAFHGKAAKKEEEANHLSKPGTVILLHGGFAVGKLSGAGLRRAQTEFDRLGLKYPGGFFVAPVSSAVGAEAPVEDETWEFDRSDEEAAEAAELGALQADKKRRQQIRAGGGGGAAASSSEEEEEEATVESSAVTAHRHPVKGKMRNSAAASGELDIDEI